MEVENEIRKRIDRFFDWINHPQIQNYYIKNLENWNALCAALHIINDIQRPKEEYHSLKTINYLQTIGIIQTIYIEQDSVETLKYALYEQDREKFFSLSNYKAIRDIRNKVFGHPSEKKLGKIKTRHFFDIIDGDKEIVEHIYWRTEAEIESEHFVISDLVDRNSKITIAYLDDFEKELKLKFKKIMDEYEVKFDEIFKSASYIFEKLLTMENDFITINTYTSIEEEIVKVKKGLKERDVFEDYEREIAVIDFLNKRLKALFNIQTYKDIEFYTYATTLRDNINRITKDLKEVDKIFK